jgi:DNA-binding IclR family transcriptional regulator
MAEEERITGSEDRLSLSGRILDYVSDHPGARLSAIEKGVGATRVEVAEAIQELMHQGKLRKDEETKEYFPLL